MRVFRKLGWLEFKLFAREPLALIFTFAFPLVVLLSLVGSFKPDDPAFGGARPSDYYLAGYVAVVIGAIGLITLPVHVASYRERGVLRRFHASGMPTWGVFGAQVVVTLVLAAVGGVVLTVAGMLIYGARLPESPTKTLLAFLLATFAFLAVGFLIGTLVRGARAAQAIGLVLFFPLWLLSGAGPPPDVMGDGMRTISDVLPLTYVVRALQGPWLGEGIDGTAMALLAGIGVVAAALSLRSVRRA